MPVQIAEWMLRFADHSQLCWCPDEYVEAVSGADAEHQALLVHMRRRCGASGSASATRISVDDVQDVRHFGQVDDWCATFEWSEGGSIHAHMAFWVVGAPRQIRRFLSEPASPLASAMG